MVMFFSEQQACSSKLEIAVRSEKYASAMWQGWQRWPREQLSLASAQCCL